MKKSQAQTTHTEIKTTVRAKAGYWPYSCSFFCQRQTDSDVLDPKDSYKIEEKAEEKEPERLTHK